jgi:hypothetical protein
MRNQFGLLWTEGRTSPEQLADPLAWLGALEEAN